MGFEFKTSKPPTLLHGKDNEFGHFSVEKESHPAMSQPQENLLPAVTQALVQKQGKFTAHRQGTSMFRGYRVYLSENLYGFLEDPLDILPFARWLDGLSALIPDGLPQYPFAYELTLDGDQVLARPEYQGQDEDVRTQAALLTPTDVTQSLREAPVHRGIDGRSQRDHLQTELEGAKKRELDFQLDHSPMGGSYMRWKEVEAALPSAEASEQLCDYLHDWLIAWSVDSAMDAPYDTYTLKLRRGRIRLTMDPCFPSEQILDELIADMELPSELNRDMADWQIRDALMYEYEDLWEPLEKKAIELTREQMGLDVDLTDLLSTRPVLTERDWLDNLAC